MSAYDAPRERDSCFPFSSRLHVDMLLFYSDFAVEEKPHLNGLKKI